LSFDVATGCTYRDIGLFQRFSLGCPW